MVQGLLVGVVLMRIPRWEVGHQWEKIRTLEAVDFIFPSAISSQNKADCTSEGALIQDLGEIIRIYILQGLNEEANVWNEKGNDEVKNRRR